MLKEADKENAWIENIRKHSWVAPEVPMTEPTTSADDAGTYAEETCPGQVSAMIILHVRE